MGYLISAALDERLILLEVGENVELEPLFPYLLAHHLPHILDYAKHAEPRGNYFELAAEHGALVDQIVDKREQQKRVDSNMAEYLGVLGVSGVLFVPPG